MHLGATLQLLRGHSGESLRSLAAKVGVSAAYLSRLEHGHDGPPTAERAAAIAAALGLPAPLVTSLVDEVRGDAAEWLRGTPTGRRLAAELRRRRLSEAQLARVLAFVQAEFPLEPRPPVAGLLAPARILLRVRLTDLADVWTLAALRIAEGDDGARVGRALREEGAQTSAVGDGAAISYLRGGTAAPRACLLVGDEALGGPTPDGRPVRAVWALAGIGTGPMGAEVLARVARLADQRLVDALGAVRTAEQALALIERFEARGSV